MNVNLYPTGSARLHMNIHTCGAKSVAVSVENNGKRGGYTSEYGTNHDDYMARSSFVKNAKTTIDLVVEVVAKCVESAIAEKTLTKKQAETTWKYFCQSVRDGDVLSRTFSSYGVRETELTVELDFTRFSVKEKPVEQETAEPEQVAV